MQITNPKNNIISIYEKIILSLLVVYSIAGDVYAVNSLGICNLIELIATLIIAVVGIAKYFRKNISDYSSWLYFLFLTLILLMFKFSYFMLTAFSLGITFSSISAKKTVYIYKYLTIIQLLFGIFASAIGILPMHNYKTGSFTFGFINENITGMLLVVFVLCMFFGSNDELIINKHNVVLLIGTILAEKFLFDDSTALIMIISFFAFFVLKNEIKKYTIIQLICIISPIALAMLAFYVSYNFDINSSNWISKLNDLISARIYIWNYYTSNYPITLFPSSWQINQKIFSGYLDGGYIYLGVFQGKIILTIITIGLSLANFRLIRHNEFGLLAFMLAFEIAGFSENVIININESFALIFAFLAYNPIWMKKHSLVV